MTKKIFLVLVASLLSIITNAQVIVIHGGAGNISTSTLTSYDEISYKEELDKTIEAGYEMLNSGASAVDVCANVVAMMENSPLFNAGKGAAFTREGHNELEAAIMDGSNLHAGAIAYVKTVKNPILGALKVMTNSSAVLMVGEPAENFCKLQGLKMVDNSYFFSFDRWNDFRNLKQREIQTEQSLMKLKGTVGCVCLDKYGNIASATSTGGTNMKRSGRIGDSPLIGLGTYADNNSCAISCAGHGEVIITHCLASTVSNLIKYKKLSLEEACEIAIKSFKQDQEAALIAVDKYGHYSIKFNTIGMFRAFKTYKGEKEVKLFD